MARRFLVLGMLVLGILVAPAVATGTLFVADEPIPAGQAQVVESARSSLHDSLDGMFGLRFVSMECSADAVVVWFDMLGPIAPGRAAVAISDRPVSDSDPRWWGGIASSIGDHRDAAAMLGNAAVPCG